jgi:hypothetical protein
MLPVPNLPHRGGCVPVAWRKEEVSIRDGQTKISKWVQYSSFSKVEALKIE